MLIFSVQVACLLAFLPLACLAQSGSLEDWKSHLSPHVGSPQHAVDKMLEMANLKSGEMLYDLGCGDGRILIAAARRYHVKAVGVEISERLVKTASENVRKAGLEDQIRIVHGNLLKEDLSGANVVTLYLATTANDTLRPRLERYLRPNSRVVSYDYPIPGWKVLNSADTEGRNGATHTIYVYEVPDSINKK